LKGSLALFDFDGTITHKDTLFEIIKFQKGRVSFYLGMLWLSPVFLLYFLRLTNNAEAKEQVIRFFFRGSSIVDFQGKCDLFIEKKLPGLLRKEALQKIKFHLASGHRVIVVSASAENWIQGWCKTMNIECIATALMQEGGYLTGKFASPNCQGIEKVNRIRAALTIKDYKPIYAYGDTKGDKPMLELADYPFFRTF
jgi:phosphatidylglycerophosphatase C